MQDQQTKKEKITRKKKIKSWTLHCHGARTIFWPLRCNFMEVGVGVLGRHHLKPLVQCVSWFGVSGCVCAAGGECLVLLSPKYSPSGELQVPPRVSRSSPERAPTQLGGRTRASARCAAVWGQGKHLGAGTLESTMCPTAGDIARCQWRWEIGPFVIKRATSFF